VGECQREKVEKGEGAGGFLRGDGDLEKFFKRKGAKSVKKKEGGREAGPN